MRFCSSSFSLLSPHTLSVPLLSVFSTICHAGFRSKSYNKVEKNELLVHVSHILRCATWPTWVSCLLLLLVVMDYLILVSHLHILILVNVITATQQHNSLWKPIERRYCSRWIQGRKGWHKMWGLANKTWTQQVLVQRRNEGGRKGERRNRGITSQACGNKGVVMTGGRLKALQQPSIQGLTTGRCYWGFVTHWWCLLPRGLKQRKVHVCSNLLTIFILIVLFWWRHSDLLCSTSFEFNLCKQIDISVKPGKYLMTVFLSLWAM